jgi:dolichyl-phosphate-mannose--protein O-mannosyl transferase
VLAKSQYSGFFGNSFWACLFAVRVSGFLKMPPPSTVKYGSTICLKHSATGAFLKSLPKLYHHPGTSGQQMVVAAREKTDETNWLVKGPHAYGNEYPFGQEVAHGDIIRLEHCGTRRNLHSHEERRLSPISQQQEVSCIGIDGVCDENDDWVVALEHGGVWQFDQKIRLIHANTRNALHSQSGAVDEVLTNGEQEVAAHAGQDANDQWVVAASDQPPV